MRKTECNFLEGERGRPGGHKRILECRGRGDEGAADVVGGVR